MRVRAKSVLDDTPAQYSLSCNAAWHQRGIKECLAKTAACPGAGYKSGLERAPFLSEGRFFLAISKQAS